MNKKMTAVLFGISFLAMSCSKSGSSGQIQFDSHDTGILNGKLVTSSDIASKSVVKVNAKGTPKNPWEASFCTGTLVEKQFVVTAAHCLIADDGTPYSNVTVSFPYAQAAGPTGNTKISGKDFRTHPLYQKTDLASYDVALILLESEAPSDSKPASIPLNYVDPKALTLYAAGFGDTEKDDNPKKNLNWAPVNLLSESEIVKAKHKELLLEVNTKEAPIFVINQFLANATGTCNGDSGGPLFYLQGSGMILLGVTSSVMQTEGCIGRARASSVPYSRRFFADAFHHLRKLGGLEGKVQIPAWENRNSLSTDSQNIEIWRAPIQLPLELKLANEPYFFRKARMVSAKSLHLRMYNGVNTELQISTDDKFNCSSESQKEHSSPTIALPLYGWPERKMIETEGYFLVLKDRQFQREYLRAQIFEINKDRAKLNIMNSNNPVTSVEIDVLDCRVQ